MSEFPQLILKSGRDRSVLRRHPWIFSGGIKERPKAGEGATVEVRDNKGEVLGYGHYDPSGTLICRMFAFGSEPIELKDEYWLRKFRAALAYRKTFLDPASTNGFRLIHAEGDGLPGVIVDIYGEVASVQLRIKGAWALAPQLRLFLREEMGIKAIFESRKEKEPGSWVDEIQGDLSFLENGYRFQADVDGGQKTGFFLDQRESRKLVGEYAKDRILLNAFSYSGAFSVYALGGGARQVISVDASARANEQCEAHISQNFPDGAPHEVLTADCFEYLKQMPKDKFDMVILDPPAFTKHISTVKKAARGYKEINLKALRKIKPGGFLFTYSCSQHISRDLFRKIIFGAAADAGRQVRIVNQLTQGPDHPIDLFHPEGEYLKGLQLYIGE